MALRTVTHVLGTGELAVEVAPGYFKIAGHPIHGQVRIDHHVFGGATPVDSTETIDVTDRDFERISASVEAHAEFLKAYAELGDVSQGRKLLRHKQ